MPRLVQISFSAIPDDPRVRRHGDALAALGWDVIGLGLAGGRSRKPLWSLVEIGPTEISHTPEGAPEAADTIPTGAKVRKPIWKSALRGAWFFLASPIGAIAWVVGRILALNAASQSGFFSNLAKVIWTDIGLPVRVLRRFRQAHVSSLSGALLELEKRQPVAALIDAGRAIGAADIWVANDWTALPVAVALRDEFGGAVVYDSHEFATEEYAQDWAWRKFERPIAATIERKLIAQARAITAVSSGIASALRDAYGIDVPHDVVINAPPFQVRPFNPTRPPFKLLYHGILAPGRGLEILIKAAAKWRGSHVLSIRGPGREDYVESLKTLARRLNVDSNVLFLDPVPMTELVSAAAPFDIGIMALPGHSAHNQFALPNKVFEYMAAGLALAVSDLPEMARIISEAGCGAVLPSDNPDEIAAHFDAMSAQQIDDWKCASLEAAKIYNGERSAETLDQLYRNVLKNGAN